MRLLNRYILRQIWWPMLLASVVISFVVIAGAIQQEIKELVKDVPIAQFTAWDISRVSFFILPTMVGYVFPITFLFGIMLSFGQLARHSELIAMKASGIPLRKVVTPIIVTGAFLSLMCFWVQDVGQPWAYKRLAQLLHSDLPLRITLDMLPTGVMHDYGQWRVYIGDKEEDGTLRDVVVLQDKEGGVEMTHAERASLQRGPGGSVLRMESVNQIPAGLRSTNRLESFELGVPGLEARKESSEQRDGLKLRGLLAAYHQADAEYLAAGADNTTIIAKERYDLGKDISERLALPLMCLAVSFAGAPIGARTRRSGRSYTFGLGFVIVAVYFVLQGSVEKLSFGMDLPAMMFLGQLPNLVLFVAGGLLLWRVDRV